MTPDNIISLYTLIFLTVYTIVLSLFYGSELAKYVFVVIFTMINVEYLARLLNGLDIYLNIDVITVYLLNWQMWALVFAWMWHELASPILLIEQGSLCILIGLEAFMLHNIALRYVPTIVMILLWLLSFVDK